MNGKASDTALGREAMSDFSLSVVSTFQEMEAAVATPSSAVSAANEALQRNDAAYFSSLSHPEIEKICKSADEDGR